MYYKELVIFLYYENRANGTKIARISNDSLQKCRLQILDDDYFFPSTRKHQRSDYYKLD